ncbi:serine hydrolase [Bordetella muralis]|uniref:serine hydrolase n=1 Tax=Bordetella muralis TaxID=1649130 RepID=UPI0039EEF92E
MKQLFPCYRHSVISATIAAVMAVAGVGAAYAYNLDTSEATAGRKLTTEQVARALPAFEAYANDLLARSGLPGMAVGIIVDGKPVLARGYGVRDVRSGKPVDADTLFPLASVSKVFAGASVAALVGDDAVQWDSKVSDLVSGIRFQDPYVTSEMTLRDLLSQRTGYASFYGDDLEVIFSYPRAEVFKRLRHLPPVTPFRTQYAYSNWNLTLAGEVAAQAAGMSWEDLVRSRIIKPLGMNHTVVTHEEFLGVENRSAAHELVNGKAVATEVNSHNAEAPAGGVYSTLNDMLRFVAFEMNAGQLDGKQIVSEDAMHETQTAQTIINPAFPSLHYGLGLEVRNDNGRKVLEHNGAFEEGINTRVSFLPAQGLGIVILTNTPPMGVPDALEYKLMTLLFGDRPDQDIWPDLRDKWHEALAQLLDRPGRLHGTPPAGSDQVIDAKRYVGRYTHPYYGDIVIRQEGNGLLMVAGASAPRAMQHWQGDTFRIPMLQDAAMNFVPGADQTTSGALTLSEIDDIPDALFVRQP